MGSTVITTTLSSAPVTITFVTNLHLFLFILWGVNMSASSANNSNGEQVEVESWWQGIPEEEYIVKLNSSNFDSYVNSSITNNNNNSAAVIMFYRNWCEDSQMAREGIAGAAQPLSNQHNITVGALDCEQAESVCQNYDVKTVPTFVYLWNGTVVGRNTEEEGWTKQKFMDWVLMVTMMNQERANRNDRSSSSSLSTEPTASTTFVLTLITFSTVLSSVQRNIYLDL